MPALAKAFNIAFSGTQGQIDHEAAMLNGIAVGGGDSRERSLRMSAVWIANTLIADELSTLPLRLVAREDKIRRPQRPAPVRPLWGDPNTDDTWQTTIQSMSMEMTLTGVSYSMLDWTNRGTLTGIWPLQTTGCALTRGAEGSRVLMLGSGQHLTNRPGQRPEFLMVPFYKLAGDMVPISPVQAAARLLGLAEAYDQTAANLMRRGLNPSAILTANQTVSPEVAEELGGRITQAHGGGAGAGGVVVIGGKDVKLERMTMSMADSEFLAQRQDVFDVTMALWRVPPTVAGMADKASSWGTGVAEFARGLERFTIRAIAKRFEAAIESGILRHVSSNLQARFIHDAMLSASPRDKNAIQRNSLAAGMTSVERVLAQNDEAPFSDDETVFSQLAQATDEDREVSRLTARAAAVTALVATGIDPATASRMAGLSEGS